MQTTTETPQARLEKLQALGFESEADYTEHQRVLSASRTLAKKQLATIFTAPSEFN